MFQCQMSNNCGGRVILFQNIQKNVGIRLGHQRVLHFMVTQPRDAVPVGVLLVEGKFSQLPDAMEGVKLGENNVGLYRRDHGIMVFYSLARTKLTTHTRHRLASLSPPPLLHTTTKQNLLLFTPGTNTKKKQ